MDQLPVTKDVLVRPDNPSHFWRVFVKKLSLGFVSAALLAALLIAQPNITHAGCKSTAGHCTISISQPVS